MTQGARESQVSSPGGGDETAYTDFGWHLGVLLRGYQTSVAPLLGDLPHGSRGYQVLAAVVDGGQPSQLSLAEHLGIDRTVMTYLVDDLVAAGLVERRQNPADRRARQVVATPAGTRTLQTLQQHVRDAEDSLLRSLSPAERSTFRQVLRTVACDLRSIEPAVDVCTVAEDIAANDHNSALKARPRRRK